jgi:hypothetical protein
MQKKERKDRTACSDNVPAGGLKLNFNIFLFLPFGCYLYQERAPDKENERAGHK